MSSAYVIFIPVFDGGVSCVYVMKSVVERFAPWGTPHCIIIESLYFDFSLTFAVLFVRKLHSRVSVKGGRFRLSNLCLRPVCHTLSNAFEISLNTMWH